MADTLEGLGGEEVTLESLNEDMVSEAPKTLAESNKNIASHAALMAGDDGNLPQTYAVARAQADNGDNTMLRAALNRHAAIMQQVTEPVMMESMADTEATAKEKAQLLAGFESLQKKYEVNERQVLRESFLEVPSEGATEYDEDVRTAAAVEMTSDEAVRELERELINEKSKYYIGKGRAAEVSVDIASYWMVPFTEHLHAAGVLEPVKKQDAGWSLLGTYKKEFAEFFGLLTPQQRLDMTRSLIEYLNSADGTVLFMENDMAKMQFLEKELLYGRIDASEVIIDNIASLADLVLPFAGKAIRGAVRLVKGGSNVASTYRAISAVNPGQARKMMARVVADDSDELAQAAGATNRTDFIAEDLAPELNDGTGITRNDKAYDPTKVDHFSSTEKETAVARAWNGFENTAPELHMNTSDLRFNMAGSNIEVNAVYGRDQGGWLLVKDALDTVKFGLKDYGVGDDSIEILVNTQNGYRVLPKSEWKTAGPGDYKARIKHNIEMSALDATDGSILDVYHGPAVVKTVQQGLANWDPKFPRYLMSPGDMFKEMYSFASTGVEQAAQLERNMLDMGADFGKKFNKLKKQEQSDLWQYLKEANEKGFDHTRQDLIGMGMSDKAIDAWVDWRKFWDEAWRIENQDVRRTYVSRGYKVLESDNTKLFVRPIDEANASENFKLFDPVTGGIVKMDAEELKILYEDGGTIAKLSSAEKIGDDVADYVLVDGAYNNYLRSFNEYDELLAYRPGYHKTMYNSPVFVRHQYAPGKWRAVAVADNSEDARRAMEMRIAEEGVDPSEYTITKPIESGSFDDEFTMMADRTRSAQRMRGERLVNASDPENVSVSDRHVKGPVDSMIAASRSIARRAPMRNWMEGMKKRWVDRYGDLVKDGKGWPGTHQEIGAPGAFAHDVAAAKQAWEYIRYMENGYVAGLDNVVKAPLNMIARVADLAGFSKTEGAVLRAADKFALTSTMKGAAFNAYLATNPFRQMLVQSHQFTQLLAVAPKYVAVDLPQEALLLMTGTMLKSRGLTKMYSELARQSGRTVAELDAFVDGFKNSGLVASIDHQNLVESSLNQLVDSWHTKANAASGVSTVIGTLRSIGFDAGETANLASAYLTMRHMDKVDGAVVDTIDNTRKWAQSARNFTYQMNRAGDMPYNQNSLGAILQFMQVPHKALTTMLFNRQLSHQQKLSLFATNLALYGIPSTLIYNTVSNLTGIEDNPVAADIVQNGLEQFVLNKAIEAYTGEPSSLSLKNISPLEFGGWAEIFRSATQENFPELIKKTPSGALLAGKVPEVIRMMGQGLAWDREMPELEAMDRIKLFLSISSGGASAINLLLMEEYGKKYSRNGNVTDSSLTTVEEVASIFGIPSKEAEARYRIAREQYNDVNNIKKDVAEWYKQYRRTMLLQGDLEDNRASLKMLEAAWSVWDKPEYGDVARREFLRLFNRDMADSDTRMIRGMIRMWGIQTTSDFKRQMRELDLPQETQDAIIKMMEAADG